MELPHAAHYDPAQAQQLPHHHLVGGREPSASPPQGVDQPADPALPYVGSRVGPAGQPPAAQAALSRLMYGSLSKLQHGSRTSLPDIQEEHDLLFSMDGQAAASQECIESGSLAGAPPAVGGSLAGQTPAGPPYQSRMLLVHNIEASVTEAELRGIFEAFGEINGLALQQGHAVVSYYDSRAATLARHTLQGQDLHGLALDLQYTSPGDEHESGQGVLLVACLDAYTGHDELLLIFSQCGEVQQVTQDPSRPGCWLVQYYDTRHAAAALRFVSQSPELSSRILAMEPGSASAAGPPAAAAQLLQTSGSSGMLSAYPTSAAATSVPAGLFAGAQAGGAGQVDAAALLASGIAAGPAARAQGVLGAGPAQQQALSGGLAGMTRSLSEMSLGSGLDNAALGGRLAANSMSTGDLLALTQGLQQQQQRPAGPYGLRGIASTGSIWPQQMGASLGSSPISSGIWPAQLHGSAGNLQDVLQQQQTALQQQAALNAAILQGAAAGALLQPNPLVQNAAMQAALQQALLTQQAAAILQGNMVQGALLGSQRRSEPPLGGRLARRPLDPVAEAERRAQQEKLYSLDLGKIRAGEDKRTTLMVKNIPNKYTQKMLLSLIEEKFSRTYDFFYLPIDFKNKCNVGYAFINMVKPEYIPSFVEEFHGRKWPKFNSEKICQIAYGRIQGKDALVQHFQNSSLLHEDKRCRPVLFRTHGDVAGPEPEPFPSAGQ